jgi:hypothetical protein
VGLGVYKKGEPLIDILTPRLKRGMGNVAPATRLVGAERRLTDRAIKQLAPELFDLRPADIRRGSPANGSIDPSAFDPLRRIPSGTDRRGALLDDQNALRWVTF